MTLGILTSITAVVFFWGGWKLAELHNVELIERGKLHKEENTPDLKIKEQE